MDSQPVVSGWSNAPQRHPTVGNAICRVGIEARENIPHAEPEEGER